jgi:hypothetical protein
MVKGVMKMADKNKRQKMVQYVAMATIVLFVSTIFASFIIR